MPPLGESTPRQLTAGRRRPIVSLVDRIGPYRIVRTIAVGGMGEVYLAALERAGGFEKRVALKCVLPRLMADPRFVELFEREARLAAALSHRHIVQIFDFGRDRGRSWLAMEYVHGVDLKAVLDRAPGALPLGVAVEIGIACARALDYAHRARDPRGRPLHLIHRDVSPQNVLLGFEGDVKLADFGLAHAAARDPHEGGLQGKFAYMSPEQVEGVPLDARSDQFALGVVLYEMVSGGRAFFGDDGTEAILDRVRRAAPQAPLAEVAPELPTPLRGVIERAMRATRTERFADAGALADALHDAAARSGIRVGEPALGPWLRAWFPERSVAPSAVMLASEQTAAGRVEPTATAGAPITPAAEHTVDAGVPIALARSIDPLARTPAAVGEGSIGAVDGTTPPAVVVDPAGTPLPVLVHAVEQRTTAVLTVEATPLPMPSPEIAPSPPSPIATPQPSPSQTSPSAPSQPSLIAPSPPSPITPPPDPRLNRSDRRSVILALLLATAALAALVALIWNAGLFGLTGPDAPVDAAALPPTLDATAALDTIALDATVALDATIAAPRLDAAAIDTATASSDAARPPHADAGPALDAAAMQRSVDPDPAPAARVPHRTGRRVDPAPVVEPIRPDPPRPTARPDAAPDAAPPLPARPIPDAGPPPATPPAPGPRVRLFTPGARLQSAIPAIDGWRPIGERGLLIGVLEGQGPPVQLRIRSAGGRFDAAVDARPWGRVLLGERQLGPTPAAAVPLEPGRQTLRVIGPDGGETVVRIEIAP